MFGKKEKKDEPDIEAEFVVLEPEEEKVHKPEGFSLGSFFRRIFLIIPFFVDTLRGRYTGISFSKLILFLLAFLYLLSPFDLLPDFIPFSGILDDLLLLFFFLQKLLREVGIYEEWRKN